MKTDGSLKDMMKFIFPNRGEFIKQAQINGLSDDVIHYGLKVCYDYNGYIDIPRDQLLSRIIRMQSAYNREIRYQDPPKKVMERITRFATESHFTKNRKEKLSCFMVELYRWKNYLSNLTYAQLRQYDCLYWNFSDYIMSEYYPLPVSLISKWVTQHIPLRKEAIRFKQDILDRVNHPEIREFLLRCYSLNTAGTEFLLEKNLPCEVLSHLEKILRKINYRNNSKSKYRIYMEYLISKGILEKSVNYSTKGRCNYFKIIL